VAALRTSESDLNGIEFVEVDSDLSTMDAGSQFRLRLFFVKPLHLPVHRQLQPDNIRIISPQHVAPIAVTSVEPEGTDQILVTIDGGGGDEWYRLELVDSAASDQPPPGFDRWLATIRLTFATNRAVHVDFIEPPHIQPLQTANRPAHYLARDYPSFLQLLYDRLALKLPNWRERHVPDLMVTLVELLAYVGDYLSYYQDAVGTEAYLATARHRISVRRHLRLVDYRLHEGCNSRVWVCLTAKRDATFRHRIRFIAGLGGEAPATMSERQMRDSRRHSVVVFESIGKRPIHVRCQRNKLKLYTANGMLDTVPAGATSAILVHEEADPELEPGQAIMFVSAEVTHPVRLLRARPYQDPVSNQWLTEVSWSPADALPMPLATASTIVNGNVVLADEGDTQALPDLVISELSDPSNPLHPTTLAGSMIGRLDIAPLAYAVPFPDRVAAARFQACLLRSLRPHLPPAPRAVQTRQSAHEELEYHQMLARANRGHRLSRGERRRLRRLLDERYQRLEHAVEQPLGSAASAMSFKPADAMPCVTLVNLETQQQWESRPDLLGSEPDDCHFTIEVDDGGSAWIRFGDGVNGRQPVEGQKFSATCRVSHGPAATVGARRINVLVPDEQEIGEAGNICRVTNPAPAFGGAAPESVEHARLTAPTAYKRIRERAVLAGDYAELARQMPGITDASASHEFRDGIDYVHVAVLGGAMFSTDAMRRDLAEEIQDRLQAFRTVGQELRVSPARRVPLHIELDVQTQPGRIWAQVERDVFHALGTRRLSPTRIGYFHPDNVRLGQTLAASGLVATVQAVPGVLAVRLVRFERADDASATGAPRECLTFAHDEAPHLVSAESQPTGGPIALRRWEGEP
jgi:hypothetical protein